MGNIYLRWLRENIQHGRLDVILAGGQVHSFGTDGPHASIVLHDDSVLGRILREPELMLGETYMDGAWDAVDGNLPGLFEVSMLNFPEPRPEQRNRVTCLLHKLSASGNRIVRSYRNVAHHYDLDEWLFRLFLIKTCSIRGRIFMGPTFLSKKLNAPSAATS